MQLLHLLAAAALGVSAATATSCASGYVIRGACVPAGQSPLDYYVNDVKDAGLPDAHTTASFTSAGGCAVTVLNFTSQRWLSDAEFKGTSAAKSVWSHQLIVAAPPARAGASAAAETGWLWITGGHNPDATPPAKNDSELEVACALARSSDTIGAVLHQVPNQVRLEAYAGAGAADAADAGPVAAADRPLFVCRSRSQCNSRTTSRTRA